VQLRHLRAGNQINAMLTIGDEFRLPAFVDAELVVHKCSRQASTTPFIAGYSG
jgi:hypothetical protein